MCRAHQNSAMSLRRGSGGSLIATSGSPSGPYPRSRLCTRCAFWGGAPRAVRPFGPMPPHIPSSRQRMAQSRHASPMGQPGHIRSRISDPAGPPGRSNAASTTDRCAGSAQFARGPSAGTMSNARAMVPLSPQSPCRPFGASELPRRKVPDCTRNSFGSSSGPLLPAVGRKVAKFGLFTAK